MWMFPEEVYLLQSGDPFKSLMQYPSSRMCKVSRMTNLIGRFVARIDVTVA